MKNLLVLLISFITINSFCQEYYLIDSSFVRYKIGKDTYRRKSFKATEDVLSEHKFFRMATADNINMSVSDSLTKQYKAKKSISFNNVRSVSYMVMDKIAVDSSTNILYVMVETTCGACSNSIIKSINSDNDIVSTLKEKNLKYVRVNYSQIEGDVVWDFITVKIKHRFKRSYIYYLYSQKENELEHQFIDENEYEFYEEDNE